MKTIEKDELYQTISRFMKSKGLELTDGPYAGHIRRGCDLLSEAINTAQRAVVRAREEVDKKLLQLRQCIHEATAPPAPSPPTNTAPPAAAADLSGSSQSNPKLSRARKKPATRRQPTGAKRRTRRSKLPSDRADE